MVKYFAALAICFFTLNTLAVWELPNTPMTGIGDPGSFYLNRQGLTLHLFNNDYIGETDKLMTASGSLFLYWQASKNHGWELSAQRRLTTPIIKTRSGEPAFDPPQGIYGDQLESRLGYSYVNGHFKFESAVSGEYYAGLGGHRITDFIHKVIGAKDETDKYGEKIDNSFLAGSIGFGFLTKYALFMVYGHESPVMREAIARLNFVFGGSSFKIGFQGEVVQQFQSDFYVEDIENYRYGYGLSMKWDWYQLTANYVSPYLKYDKYGQYFISPLILSWEF